MKRIVNYLFLAAFLSAHLSLLAVPAKPGLGLVEPAHPQIPQNIRIRHNMPAAFREIGDRNMAEHGLVILVEFSDKKFQSTNKRADFDSLMNADNYNYNGATGSVRRYFRDQSNDQYKPHFDVIGPVTMPHNMAYYGTNDGDGTDRYLADFVMDAVTAADDLGVDFTPYDNNHDGVIDFIYFIYAGYGEADSGISNTIWPHNWSLSAALYFGGTTQETYYYSDYGQNLPTVDGLYYDNYACSMELRYSYYDDKRTGIATIAHEFSHVLGLPDLYDTNYGNNYYSGYTPGSWDLMDNGSYNNDGNTPPNYSVYEKYYLGWITPEMLRAKEINGSPVTSFADTLRADGQSYRMLSRNMQYELTDAERNDTVYYFENRQQSGWDAYVPGHGMVVWQVVWDYNAWYDNAPNNTSSRPRCSIVCSSDLTLRPDYFYSGQAVTFPGSSNVTSYAPFGNQHVRLSNIKEVTLNGKKAITFNVTTPNDVPVDPTYTFYIRNNWAGGSYTWKLMEPVDSTSNILFEHTDIFGKQGVYINSVEKTTGATYFSATNGQNMILGDSIMLGDTVRFEYNRVAQTLTATLLGRPEIPEAIDEISASENTASKVFVNGMIYIRREDGLYTLTGQRIR